MSSVVLNSLLVGISCLLGLMIGGLIVASRHQRQRFQLESELNLSRQQINVLQAEQQRLQTELLQCQQKVEQNYSVLSDYKTELAAAQAQLQQQLLAKAEWREEYELLNQEVRMLREINSAQEAELREVTTRLEDNLLAFEEKQRILIDNEQRVTLQFENLANRIFDRSSRRVEEQSRQGLEGLLVPLREQLEGFKRQIQESFSHEAQERHTLTFEIRNLQQLNAQMAQEAINLTNALKNDNKTQGNWGEVVLSRILESSGLQEGREYFTQVTLYSEEGERFQPDVVVKLPQERDVVIDAKMSLIAYERYFNAETEEEKNRALADHLASIRQHMKILSRKDYQNLVGIRTLDYVLMFIPVEPAFLLAINRDSDLINEGLKYNIMLVSPATLLIALRTISNLWRSEYQSQHAKLIAERATKLYDKVRLFIDDMLFIGQSLDKAQVNYQQAMNKLCQGRGNIVGQIETFRSLGVDIKRPINPGIAEQAIEQFDNSESEDVETGSLQRQN